MDQSEKLLMGIERILSVASDLVDEVARLKSVEEEWKILKEKVFMNQLTKAGQEVFALDGHSISAIQDIFHKEECTIKNQKRSILKKWNTSCMTESVQQFLNLYQESSQELIRTS
ncbi:LuxR family transcriptional regulator [Priestia megaterium]|uniref:LuxR family transcriptional regulator n=1 Tax=Priestia megaterium TaxID=1404 RepID=UPI003F7D987B